MDDTDSKQMLTFFDELQQEPSAELKQAMAVLVVASGERLEKKLAAQRAANAPPVQRRDCESRATRR